MRIPTPVGRYHSLQAMEKGQLMYVRESLKMQEEDSEREDDEDDFVGNLYLFSFQNKKERLLESNVEGLSIAWDGTTMLLNCSEARVRVRVRVGPCFSTAQRLGLGLGLGHASQLLRG